MVVMNKREKIEALAKQYPHIEHVEKSIESAQQRNTMDQIGINPV
jgi:hypothetical protein